MSNKIAFFLPTRSGSQRVPHKNTRNFAGIEGGLTQLKLLQLINTRNIDEIILSTNDDECISIAENLLPSCKRLRIAKRPDKLCMSSTNLQDLIEYVPSITDAKHILWGHVTTPFVGSDDYDQAIEIYLDQLKKGFDSLMGVQEIQNYIYSSDFKLMNNSTKLPWPRTQDLDILHELNHSIFIASRDVYIKYSNRHGKSPFFLKMNKLKSLDIDSMEDFSITEMIYKQQLLEKGLN